MEKPIYYFIQYFLCCITHRLLRCFSSFFVVILEIMIDMEKFLEAINDRPSIWNDFDPDFRNAQKKRDDWKEITMMFVPPNASSKMKKKIGG